jgi:hypothetical protein
MKLRLTLIAILALFLLGAKGAKVSTLTLVNKSGMSVNVSILANDLSKNYFLNIPEGSRTSPYTTKVTIISDTYRMRVFWLGDKDPATGGPCRVSHTAQLVAERNIRIVINECNERNIPVGEPTMYKFITEGCMY